MHVNFVLHINRRLRLLACLLAVGVHAFAPAPILWGVVHTKSFVLAPKHVLGKTLGSIRAAGPADELMLWDPSGMIPTSEIPRFTVKPDRTITWDSTDLCIEASGHNTGDFVNLNRCSAEWTQLWDVLSLGFKQKQIQLRGTNMCLDVVDNGGVDRNRIQLQECANRATESWVFEQSTPPSKQKPTQRVDPSFLLRHVIVACGAMIGLTALSLKAWQWHQQHKKCEVIVGHNDVPLNVDEGGVCLTMPLRLSNIRMMSSPGRRPPVSRNYQSLNRSAGDSRSDMGGQKGKGKKRSDASSGGKGTVRTDMGSAHPKHSGGKKGGKGSKDPDRQQAYEAGKHLAKGEPVWNFAFGANVNPWKLQQSRGIVPLQTARAKLPGWRLAFRHRGGFGTIEKFVEGEVDPKLPDAVHGLLLKLKPLDFATLCSMEHQYDAVEVEVHVYPEDAFKIGVDSASSSGQKEKEAVVTTVKARAFITVQPQFLTVARNLKPTERYISLIRNGAAESKLDPQYFEWLQSVDGLPGNVQRGSEYYNCFPVQYSSSELATSAKEARLDKSETSATADEVFSPSTADQPHGVVGGTALKLSSPTGVYVTQKGNVYVAEASADRVIRLRSSKNETGKNSQPQYAVVAGGHGKGSKPWQLNRPFRIFVNEENAEGSDPRKGKIEVLYVVDRNNNRVMRWKTAGGCTSDEEKSYSESQGEVVADGLNQPVAVCCAQDGSIFVSDRGNHRIMCWPPFRCDTSSRLGRQQGIVVAGGNGFGSQSNQLACPGGICVVDTVFRQKAMQLLIVADESNNRIQAFSVSEGQSSAGLTLVGGVSSETASLAGAGSAELYHPLSVTHRTLDHENLELFVADSLNHRVQRYLFLVSEIMETLHKTRASLTEKCAPERSAFRLPQVYTGTTVAGGCGLGSKFGQIGQPISVICNTSNLYIADSDNNRILEVDLLDSAGPQGEKLRSKSILVRQGSLDKRVTSSSPHSSLTEADFKRRRGEVVEWRSGSGFGFIRENGPQEGMAAKSPHKYFAHHSDVRECVVSGYPSLQKGATVQFCSREDDKWTWRATEIVQID